MRVFRNDYRLLGSRFVVRREHIVLRDELFGWVIPLGFLVVLKQLGEAA